MNMRLTVNEPVPRMYTQIYTPTVVQGKGGGGGGVVGRFYGLWRCWGPVLAPTVIAILAAILDFTKNWKSS